MLPRPRQRSSVQSSGLPSPSLRNFVASKNKVANLRPSALPLYTYWNIEELYLTK